MRGPTHQVVDLRCVPGNPKVASPNEAGTVLCNVLGCAQVIEELQDANKELVLKTSELQETAQRARELSDANISAKVWVFQLCLEPNFSIWYRNSMSLHNPFPLALRTTFVLVHCRRSKSRP